MQRIVFFILMAIASAANLFAAVSPADSIHRNLDPDYLKYMEQADKAIADMKWAEAIENLDQAMKVDPTNHSNVLLLSNKGMLQFYMGNDSLAIETLLIAHELAPSSVTVLQNRARVYTASGKIDRALADYERVMALDTTLVEPLFYHAMLSFQSDSLATSQADIALMKQRFPEHTSTLLAESTMLAYTGQFAEAIPLLDKIISDKPTATDYATRAMCHLMTAQLPEASEDIARGLELDPTDGELYLYRALLNKMRYRPDDAKADAEKARMYGVNSQRIKALEL